MYSFTVAKDEANGRPQWLLGEFAHGPPLKGLDSGESEMKRSVMQVDEAVELELETKKLLVKGRGQRQSDDDNGMTVVLGIVDRKKRKITLLPRSSGMVVPLAHTVKGYVAKEPEDHSSVNRGTFVREFASHREHTRVKNYANAYIQGERVAIGSVLEKARLEALEGMAAYTSERNTMVPPYDELAADPADVYSVRVMLSEELQGALMQLMCETFNNGQSIHEHKSALSRTNPEALREFESQVDESVRPFFLDAVNELGKVDGRESRECHIIAMGFVFVAAYYLILQSDFKATSLTFANSMQQFKRARRLFDKMFAAAETRANGAPGYKLAPAGKTKVMNFTTVAAMLTSKSCSVRVASLAKIFDLTEAMAAKFCNVCGLWGPKAPKMSEENREERRASRAFTLKLPLRFQQARLNQRPEKHGGSEAVTSSLEYHLKIKEPTGGASEKKKQRAFDHEKGVQ